MLVSHASFGHLLQLLGIQITGRKTQPPSQTPGPWAGTLAFVCPSGIGVACLPEKWSKAQQCILDLQAEIEQHSSVDHKQLERTRGFFIHLQRTYPVIAPFLKGMHLTLDGWRGHRDDEMWAIARSAWEDADVSTTPAPSPSEPPQRVAPAPRLLQDLTCLASLLGSPDPPTRVIRSSRHFVAMYGFVDASSAGFGGSLLLPSGAIYFRHGIWGPDGDDTSSNFKELCNLVDTIEDGVASGELVNSELFLFTDNTTAERAFYKGNTPSKLLFSLIVRLRRLELRACLQLHVIHVAGSRMVRQGTDGLSRGSLNSGVFASDADGFVVPLHLTCIDRSPAVLPWVWSWVPSSRVVHLRPDEWFTLGHGTSGFVQNCDSVLTPQLATFQWYVWTPPPAAGRVALEQLHVSRHKRPSLNHVILVPRLFTSQWRKLLHRVADVVVELPAGARACWPESMHEPLVLGLIFSLLPIPPWTLQNHRCVLDLAGQLREVWADVSQD